MMMMMKCAVACMPVYAAFETNVPKIYDIKGARHFHAPRNTNARIKPRTYRRNSFHAS